MVIKDCKIFRNKYKKEIILVYFFLLVLDYIAKIFKMKHSYDYILRNLEIYF